VFLIKKFKEKKTNATFLKQFLNAMIRNIKIHNIIDIIEISKFMEPNKCIKKNYEHVYLGVSYDFQSSMGPRKLRCDVFSRTIQGWTCPDLFHILYNFFNFL
jgi:hypothetical protein